MGGCVRQGLLTNWATPSAHEGTSKSPGQHNSRKDGRQSLSKTDERSSISFRTLAPASLTSYAPAAGASCDQDVTHLSPTLCSTAPNGKFSNDSYLQCSM
jgi:hypothetical protein